LLCGGGFVEIKDIASLTGVLVVIWGVFRYAIINPLNVAIESLSEAVKELRKEIKAGEERRHELEVKLTEIDQRARSAHHRIDDLERR
jgi:prefoldin subunit 5